MANTCLAKRKDGDLSSKENGSLLFARSPEHKRLSLSIAEKVGKQQTLTEEVFLKIGQKLPVINQAIFDLENESAYLLTYFKKEGTLLSEKGAQSDLDKLKSASRYLIKVAEEQADAFLKMSAMMKRIEGIKTSIESIREFSIEMEMLSFNAAIVAIKAGEAGRTLNPITIELKKVSNAAIKLIDEIVDTSEELSLKYAIFQQISENQASFCKSDVETLSEALSRNYEGLQDSTTLLVGELNRLGVAVGSSKEPIACIMNTLQVQDILRQCSEHVRASLRHAASTFSGEQDLSLLQEVPRLSIELLEGIDKTLLNSISDLKQSFVSIDSQLTGISLKGGTDASLHTLEESFNAVEEVVVTISDAIATTAESWQKLWSSAADLEALFKVLEKQFTKLKKTTNFHMINIPIKIEVAKSSELSKQGELSQRVEGLAEYIATELKQLHRGVVRDCDTLTQMMVAMKNYKQGAESNLILIAQDIQALFKSFGSAKDKVKTVFESLHASMRDLAKLVEDSLFDLDRIHGLIEGNGELRQELEQLAGISRELTNASFKTDRHVKDERLMELIDTFAKLMHTNAWDAGSNNNDKAGEVVLF